MSRWKQWVRPPEGALPGGIVTKAGVVLIAVLVGGLLFSWAMTGPQEADTLVALPEAQAVDDGMGRSLQNRIRQEAERQTLEAAARAELERRQAAAAEDIARLQTESEAPNTAALIPGVSAAESEQLSGDFPGPVLAMVSVPFYSADRQRVLIPRGTRVVGMAQAVQDPDQSRLAVAFHRLIMPDGSWIDLEFTGLNQAGEGALRDQVDRHYFSTFAAAGAIGIVSGLALAGGSPFGLRAGIGQGLGQSATSVLDRFLNRLPTLTIRAGHRLRVWFTSDVLVPRAGPRQ